MNSTDYSEFKHAALSEEPSTFFHLLLELQSDRMLAAKFHSAQGRLALLSETSIPEAGSQLAETLRHHPELLLDYNQVLLSYVSSNYCIVPSSLLGDDLFKVFSLTNEWNEESEVLYNHPLVNVRANILYTIPKSIVSGLYDSFKRIKIVPHIAPRIEHALNSFEGNHCVTHVSKDQVDVLIFRNGQLQLANSFFQASIEDVVYFVTYCAKSLGLDTSTERIAISGTHKDWEKLKTTLQRYWKSVDSPNMLPVIQSADGLGPFPAHSFNHITQTLLCA